MCIYNDTYMLHCLTKCFHFIPSDVIPLHHCDARVAEPLGGTRRGFREEEGTAPGLLSSALTQQ